MNINCDVDEGMQPYEKPFLVSIRAFPRPENGHPPLLSAEEPSPFLSTPKTHTTLIFYNGFEITARISNLLGDGNEARTMKFVNFVDLANKRTEI